MAIVRTKTLNENIYKTPSADDTAPGGSNVAIDFAFPCPRAYDLTLGLLPGVLSFIERTNEIFVVPGFIVHLISNLFLW